MNAIFLPLVINLFAQSSGSASRAERNARSLYKDHSAKRSAYDNNPEPSPFDILHEENVNYNDKHSFFGRCWHRMRRKPSSKLEQSEPVKAVRLEKGETVISGAPQCGKVSPEDYDYSSSESEPAGSITSDMEATAPLDASEIDKVVSEDQDCFSACSTLTPDDEDEDEDEDKGITDDSSLAMPILRRRNETRTCCRRCWPQTEPCCQRYRWPCFDCQTVDCEISCNLMIWSRPDMNEFPFWKWPFDPLRTRGKLAPELDRLESAPTLAAYRQLHEGILSRLGHVFYPKDWSTHSIIKRPMFVWISSVERIRNESPDYSYPSGRSSTDSGDLSPVEIFKMQKLHLLKYMRSLMHGRSTRDEKRIRDEAIMNDAENSQQAEVWIEDTFGAGMVRRHNTRSDSVISRRQGNGALAPCASTTWLLGPR